MHGRGTVAEVRVETSVRSTDGDSSRLRSLGGGRGAGGSVGRGGVGARRNGQTAKAKIRARSESSGAVGTYVVAGVTTESSVDDAVAEEEADDDGATEDEEGAPARHELSLLPPTVT